MRIKTLMIALVFAGILIVNLYSAERKELTTDVSLTIALTLNEKLFDGLTFILKNNTNKQFTTTDFCVNRNKLVIVKPDGKIEELTEWTKGNVEKINIKQGETKTWKIQSSLILPILDIPGIYRIQWQIDDYKSNEIFVDRKYR